MKRTNLGDRPLVFISSIYVDCALILRNLRVSHIGIRRSSAPISVVSLTNSLHVIVMTATPNRLTSGWLVVWNSTSPREPRSEVLRCGCPARDSGGEVARSFPRRVIRERWLTYLETRPVRGHPYTLLHPSTPASATATQGSLNVYPSPIPPYISSFLSNICTIPCRVNA